MRTARLSAQELVSELQSALSKGGWLSGAASLEGLAAEASLVEIATALDAYSQLPSLPSATVLELSRAAGAVEAASRLTGGQEYYNQLGIGLAYLAQANRSLAEAEEASSGRDRHAVS